ESTSYSGDQKNTPKKKYLRKKVGQHADDPAMKDSVCRDLETTRCEKSVSYSLLLLSTLWAKAKADVNETYGIAYDYGELKISTSLSGSAVSEKKFKIGKVGCAL